VLLLASTSDLVRVVTSTAATTDVHASYVDLNGSTVTPGRANASISSATTTTVVASPASSTVRNVKLLTVRNVHASLSCTVTVTHYDGTTTVEIYEATLGPGGALSWVEGAGWTTVPAAVSLGANPWDGIVSAAWGRGDPGELFQHLQGAGNISATPTNITTSIARCGAFILPANLTVNRIRFYGVGATTTVFRVAIYRLSDLARLTAELPYTTVANTWGSAGSALDLTLTAGTVYFMASAVNATGTTAGPLCVGTTTAATTGQIQSTPAGLPGSLALGSGYVSSYYFQFAVTTGALPATAATLALPAVWTGGLPAYWLDNADV
jgi:hypothetical protein